MARIVGEHCQHMWRSNFAATLGSLDSLCRCRPFRSRRHLEVRPDRMSTTCLTGVSVATPFSGVALQALDSHAEVGQLWPTLLTFPKHETVLENYIQAHILRSKSSQTQPTPAQIRPNLTTQFPPIPPQFGSNIARNWYELAQIWSRPPPIPSNPWKVRSNKLRSLSTLAERNSEWPEGTDESPHRGHHETS